MTSSKKKSVRNLKAHGRFPKFVYRAFKEKSFAEEFFLRGRFRMGNLRVSAAWRTREVTPRKGKHISNVLARSLRSISLRGQTRPPWQSGQDTLTQGWNC
jgi:hypothetical protein